MFRRAMFRRAMCRRAMFRDSTGSLAASMGAAIAVLVSAISLEARADESDIIPAAAAAGAVVELAGIGVAAAMQVRLLMGEPTNEHLTQFGVA
jgi:hypothetical protein